MTILQSLEQRSKRLQGNRERHQWTMIDDRLQASLGEQFAAREGQNNNKKTRLESKAL